jgi:polyhydroxybutyrate depolymerase
MTTRILILAVLFLSACEPTEPPSPATVVVGGDRPANLVIPGGLEDDESVPLIVTMHGYTGNASQIDSYFEMSGRVQDRGFALLLPNGLVDDEGDTFWEATDWCCGFNEPDEVDDVAYLAGLVEEARQHVNVSTVIAFGHSNGGFMAYRLACDEAADVSTVVSLAGTSYLDPSKCQTERPVSVLHIHGDADRVVKWAGAVHESGVGHSAADEEVSRWVSRAGCDVEAAEALDPVDLDGSLDGAETLRTRYQAGCAEGITVELWQIGGGLHSPRFSPALGEPVLDWLGLAPRS